MIELLGAAATRTVDARPPPGPRLPIGTKSQVRSVDGRQAEWRYWSPAQTGWDDDTPRPPGSPGQLRIDHGVCAALEGDYGVRPCWRRQPVGGAHIRPGGDAAGGPR